MVIANGKGGNRLVAVDAVASKIGLREGMLLTDATAIEPGLQAVMQDEAGEAADLKRLAIGCRRYAPWTGNDAPDGLWIDVTGATHLFVGEVALLADLQGRFARAGFSARLAIASTHAAAWGMARFGNLSRTMIADGDERRACAILSVRALNIDESKAVFLERLGLKLIGQLYNIPRESLRARFGAKLCESLDQLGGASGEAMLSLPYEAIYRSQIDFAEPVTAMPALLEAAGILIARVAAQLRDHGEGARAFTLTLIDTGGGGTEIVNALAKPSFDADHIRRLFRERFTMLESRFDERMGFDAAVLHANAVERTSATQSQLTAGKASDAGTDVHALFDRLTARLGANAVTRFDFRESHVPERAAISVPVLSRTLPPTQRTHSPRPFLLLPRPELVTALAELPDYPPRRFTWRRVSYRIARAEGPERIEGEWWKPGEDDAPPRDYYAVEEEGGRRFWLYREGLYADPEQPPQWFIHGLFA